MVDYLLKTGYVVTAYRNGEKGQTVKYIDGTICDNSTGKELTAKQVVDFFMNSTSYFHQAPEKPQTKVGENYLLIQRVKVTKENKPYLDKHLDKLYDASLYDDLYLHINGRKVFK